MYALGHVSLSRAQSRGEVMQLMASQIAIITGASSGIGLVTCEAFLEKGVIILGIARKTCPERLASHENFKYFACDLLSPGASQKIVDECKKQFGGRIDILLNIAGVKDYWASVDTVREDDFDRILATNLKAPVMLMGAVVPTMREQGSGAIVNISSKAGLSGAVAGVAYVSSKHAIVSFLEMIGCSRFHESGTVPWKFANLFRLGQPKTQHGDSGKMGFAAT